jgi:hypothetical protein
MKLCTLERSKLWIFGQGLLKLYHSPSQVLCFQEQGSEGKAQGTGMPPGPTPLGSHICVLEPYPPAQLPQIYFATSIEELRYLPPGNSTPSSFLFISI